MRIVRKIFCSQSDVQINYIFLADNDSLLAATLRQAGWTLTDKADVPSFIEAIEALITKTPHPTAPISPSFWNARVQDMSFAKVTGVNWLRNARHLKIWRTEFALKDGKEIYVGMVNANDGFKWGIIPKISPDLDSAREQLFRDLAHSGKIDSYTKVQLITPLIGSNFVGDPFFSDGKGYIVSLQ